MKYRIILFIHALLICLLQLIPNTIIVATGTPENIIYNRYSFYFDSPFLLATGSFWFLSIMILSLITLCLTVISLIKDSQWSKIAVLAVTAPQILLTFIPVYIMAQDIKLFSLVLVIIFVLVISEFTFSIISMTKGFLRS